MNDNKNRISITEAAVVIILGLGMMGTAIYMVNANISNHTGDDAMTFFTIAIILLVGIEIISKYLGRSREK